MSKCRSWVRTVCPACDGSKCLVKLVDAEKRVDPYLEKGLKNVVSPASIVR